MSNLAKYLGITVKGACMGAADVIPGVSGGVIATILGIYDVVIYKLNNLFKDFKNNVLYLLPLILGISISIQFFSLVPKVIFLPDCFAIFLITLSICFPLEERSSCQS